MKQAKKNNYLDSIVKPMLFFVAVVGIGYFIIDQFSAHAARPSTGGVAPASQTMNQAPVFTLPDLSGRSVSLSDYRGKVVILDFWATWCPPCKREIPDFISLQQEYAARGLQIIGVGLDEPDNVRSFAKEHGINYPVLLGNDVVSNMYGGIDGIPTTFIIDKQGNIARRFEGFTERAVFEREIRTLF